MRKWGGMHPALRAVFVGVVACAVILAVGLFAGASPDDAISNAVFYALLIGGGLFFMTSQFPAAGPTLNGRRKRVIFLRFRDSPPGSLGSIWQMGIASAGPSRIDFQPTTERSLIPSGRSRAFTGLGTTGVPARKASRHDHQQDVPLDFWIIIMDSDSGVIEIAAQRDTLQQIQHAVGSASP